MTIADPIVLPADVVLVPVEDLPPETLGQIEHAPGDFAVTRPRTRSTSSIVVGSTAGLLERFRAPKTIVEAIVEYAHAEALDPNETLEHAFPMLARFLNSGMLVAADSELATPIAATVAPGERIGAFTVVEPVHVIDDTEVHLARAADGSLVALKLARTGSDHELRAAFDHEATVLAALSGTVNPALVERGAADGRELLAVTWCPGVDVLEAAAGLRDAADARGLLALAAAVLDAYATLHAEGVLHGDVHPRNVLVGPDGRIWLIDFGLAARAGDEAVMPRGGIDLFLEPELARARLGRGSAPALTAAGEQYSVAALVYLLLTGGHTHAFALEQEAMLEQLAGDPPLPFSAHGTRGLGSVETTVARALAKNPAERFASVAALRDAFRSAATVRRARRPRQREAASLLADVLDRLRGPLLEGELEPPTASVNLGAAGLAYGALRISMARDDAGLLALADRWSHRALLAAGTADAFESRELEIDPGRFGRASLFHSAVGVHCVEALVAHARGDELARTLALEQFVAAARGKTEHDDVVFGRAGALLGCAHLLETVGGAPAVAAVGDELEAALRATLDAQPPIRDGGAHRSLGAGHGWSGYLYALLRWTEARSVTPAPALRTRLDELAELGVPAGRGSRYPREAGLPSGENPLAASWCNGAAGHVHTWLAAERVLGDRRFAELAEASAWTAFDAPDAGGDLCCGAAGRAYALLAVHRRLDDRAWLDRARALAERAARAVRRDALRRDSLYKGEVGVAVLAAELDRPAWAALPLFEREGTSDRKESP
jgi:serine/threonine-protein kinase